MILIRNFFFLFLLITNTYSLNALTFKDGKQVDTTEKIESNKKIIDLQKRIKRVFGEEYYNDPITKIKINNIWPFSSDNNALNNFNLINKTLLISKLL